MALTILSTVPATGATNVKSAPPVIEIQFSEQVNRELAETGIAITPASDMYFRWETRNRKVGSPTSPTLVKHDVLTIMVPGPLKSYENYQVVLTASKMKTLTGTAMTANFTMGFKTRPQGVHIAPSDAVGGDSRASIPNGGYKRAIVLSGGGAKGDFQVGALKYLYNTEKFYPDLIVGTSVGAINGAKLAEASTAAEHIATVTALETLWRSLRFDEDVYVKTAAFKALSAELDGNGTGFKLTVLQSILASLPFATFAALDEVEDAIERIMVKVDEVRKTSGIYTLNPLRNNWLVAPKLDFAKVRASKPELLLGSVELYSGRPTWFDKKNLSTLTALQDAILASAVMPGIFEAIKLGNEVYSDGGVREVAGLARALAAGATDILVIPTFPGAWHHLPRLNNNRYGRLEAVLGRALTELVFDEILSNDIHKTMHEQQLKNWLMGTDVRIRVIAPEMECHGTLTFHPEAIDRGITHGYECAKMVLANNPTRLPVPHPFEQTRTATYLVVDPKWPDGKVLSDPRVVHEYDGGLSEPTSTGNFKDVRIIVREGTKVVHTYPSDLLWDYSQIAVPGSDPDLESPLNPYIKGRRKGLFYAFPLHSHNEALPVSASTSRRTTNLEVEIIYSTVDGKTYREVRSKSNVTFAPNADGIMTFPVTMPAAAPSGGKSRKVRLYLRKEDKLNPPAFTIHGAGEIPDLKALTGFDAKFTNGRWESSRDAKWLPDLKYLDVIDQGLSVTVFAQPNFAGQSVNISAVRNAQGMVIQSSDRGQEVPFAIRSIKVAFA